MKLKKKYYIKRQQKKLLISTRVKMSKTYNSAHEIKKLMSINSMLMEKIRKKNKKNTT
jgi:hypothetical protein